jgi:hypothetical protein
MSQRSGTLKKPRNQKDAIKNLKIWYAATLGGVSYIK